MNINQMTFAEANKELEMYKVKYKNFMQECTQDEVTRVSKLLEYVKNYRVITNKKLESQKLEALNKNILLAISEGESGKSEEGSSDFYKGKSGGGVVLNPYKELKLKRKK